MKSLKEVSTENKILDRLKEFPVCLKLAEYLFADEEMQEMQDNRTLPYSTITETDAQGNTFDILYDVLIKQNGDFHSDWTGVFMDLEDYKKVIFEPYDLHRIF